MSYTFTLLTYNNIIYYSTYRMDVNNSQEPTSKINSCINSENKSLLDVSHAV